MTWFKDGEEFTPDDGAYGFVYEITNKVDGRKYIGRKYLSKAKTVRVKKKPKKIRVDSDWKDYYGSSNKLKEDVELLGKENFHREILCVCSTRGETNYMEAKMIFDKNALLDERYYNESVQCRIHKSHVKSLLLNSTGDEDESSA